MKICTKCKENKGLDSFGKRAPSKDGLNYMCLDCCREKGRENYSNNRLVYKKYRQEHKEERKIYLEENKEQFDEYNRNYHKEYRKRKLEELRIYHRNYQKDKRKNDIIHKTKDRLRSRLNKAMKSKGWKKNYKFSEYIGCTLEELKKHIESLFGLDMSWENYGEWHLDHKIPLASAKTVEDLYILCHYTNLQPLWAEDNLKKHDKMPEIGEAA